MGGKKNNNIKNQLIYSLWCTHMLSNSWYVNTHSNAYLKKLTELWGGTGSVVKV